MDCNIVTMGTWEGGKATREAWLIFCNSFAVIDASSFFVVSVVVVASLLCIFAYADKLAKPVERQLHHSGPGGL